MTDLDPVLHQLATAYGIATEYWDWQGQHVPVEPQTVIDVLAGLEVDAATPEAAAEALRAHEERPWTRMLPPCVAMREGSPYDLNVHVADGAPLWLWIELEGGGVRDHLEQRENNNPSRPIGDRWVGEATYRIPADLPLGYHTLYAEGGGETATMTLIVTPSWLGFPASMGERRGWGLATQLYSVRSEQSWGAGDLADLTDLAVWSAAEHGADYVLINPLHAAEPVAPMEPSPYLPTTRRFANPIYLRVERLTEYATAPQADRDEIAALLAELRSDPALADRVDRDAIWAAKRAALVVVHALPRTAGREAAYGAYAAREGDGLEAYATWCALAEEHGADWSTWPEALKHPGSDEVAAFRDAHAADVDFHRWLQWQLDEQLRSTQAAATDAGMGMGIMHDLAVGVHPRGADAWSLQDVYARGITVGAPPDAYNQNGQNWTQPPWRPDQLAEVAYAPFRTLVSTVLRHAGGIRVDHIIGLFRLWWIPAGAGPTAGTYVRYDHDALIGILALEAHRAGALVVGEDLGTVEPWVREYLRDRGILGTSILWFEFDHDGDGSPLRPEKWREFCLASVTTHDLPPTAGYLAGDHVRLREELGLLTRPLDEELAVDEAERSAWIAVLADRGLLGGDAPEAADVETTVRALHQYLRLTRSRLLCVALTDAVGDRRTQNQPGTVDEYPNWRVPLTDAAGEPVMLEDVLASPRAAALAQVVNDRRR